MANNFIIPGKVFHGIGAFNQLSTIKGTKAVIVTGRGSMTRSGYIEKARDLLEKNNIDVIVFDGVEADPSIETVMKGVHFIKNFNPDWIIGLGGCSAIDAAKAMWVFYEYPETKFDDIIPPFTIKPLRQKARFIAIPSTSGTGTEATCVAVITDRGKGTKYPLVSYELCPDIAIVDGELCRSMPPHVTANVFVTAAWFSASPLSREKASTDISALMSPPGTTSLPSPASRECSKPAMVTATGPSILDATMPRSSASAAEIRDQTAPATSLPREIPPRDATD